MDWRLVTTPNDVAKKAAEPSVEQQAATELVQPPCHPDEPVKIPLEATSEFLPHMRIRLPGLEARLIGLVAIARTRPERGRLLGVAV